MLLSGESLPSLFAISKPFGAHGHDGHGWCHYLCGTAQPSQRQRGHPAVSSLVLYQTGTTCNLWGTTNYERPQISSHKVLAWGGGAVSHTQDPRMGSYLLGWPLTAPPAAAPGKTLAPLGFTICRPALIATTSGVVQRIHCAVMLFTCKPRW